MSLRFLQGDDPVMQPSPESVITVHDCSRVACEEPQHRTRAAVSESWANGSILRNQGEEMENGIRELNGLEVEEVNGSGIMYVLGYALGYASVGASAFYGDLPAGYALL